MKTYERTLLLEQIAKTQASTWSSEFKASEYLRIIAACLVDAVVPEDASKEDPYVLPACDRGPKSGG